MPHVAKGALDDKWSQAKPQSLSAGTDIGGIVFSPEFLVRDDMRRCGGAVADYEGWFDGVEGSGCCFLLLFRKMIFFGSFLPFGEEDIICTVHHHIKA